MMKQTANRLLALLLAMMMTLSLAACGKARTRPVLPTARYMPSGWKNNPMGPPRIGGPLFLCCQGGPNVVQ